MKETNVMLKMVNKLISPILLRIRWRRSSVVLFRDKKEQEKLLDLIPNLILPRSETKTQKIIIGSIRSLAHSNLFEGGIGKSLKNAGFEVSVLRCGQFLEACETKSYFKDNGITCSMCHREFDSFKKVFDLDEIAYEEILDPVIMSEIYKFIQSTSLHEFNIWKGYSLEKEWKSALKRYYLGTDIKIDERPDVAKKFLFSTIASFEIGRTLVNQLGFTHLFTSHGIYSTWGGLAKGFKESGGDVTVWGRGYYKSGIISMKGESYLNGLGLLDRDFIGQNINYKYHQDAKKYLDSRWNLTSKSDLVDFYSYQNTDNKEFFNFVDGIDYVGFFPNVPWDGQVFVSTDRIKGIRDVIEYILRYIRDHNSIHFIIRPHPWENPERNPYIQETFLDIAKEYNLDNIDEISIVPHGSSISSYAIAERIKVAVILAGTLGIELAARGVDVIQLGRSVSSNKGIFYEPQSYQEFSKRLEEILSSKSLAKEERQKNALDWATLFYCQAHMEDPFFNFRGTHVVSVKDSINSLNLSQYLTWILEGDGLFHS
jgi:hypothetical protein